MWMCCFRGYITESIVEGQRIRDYQSNTELSYARANAVADFCLDQRNGLSETKTEQLLTVNGKSWSNPVCQKDAFGIPYRKWMCRFPGGIKFCLKEDEMIEKITGLEEE